MYSEKELERERIEDFGRRYIFSSSQYNILNSSAKLYELIHNRLNKPHLLSSEDTAFLRNSGWINLCRGSGILNIYGEPTLTFVTELGTKTVMDAYRIGGMRSSSGGITNGLVYGMNVLIIPTMEQWKREQRCGEHSRALYGRLAGAYYQYTGKKIV